MLHLGLRASANLPVPASHQFTHARAQITPPNREIPVHHAKQRHFGRASTTARKLHRRTMQCKTSGSPACHHCWLCLIPNIRSYATHSHEGTSRGQQKPPDPTLSPAQAGSAGNCRQTLHWTIGWLGFAGNCCQTLHWTIGWLGFTGNCRQTLHWTIGWLGFTGNCRQTPALHLWRAGLHQGQWPAALQAQQPTSSTSVALFTSTQRTLPSLHITATVAESGKNASCVAPVMSSESGRRTACSSAPLICREGRGDMAGSTFTGREKEASPGACLHTFACHWIAGIGEVGKGLRQERAGRRHRHPSLAAN